VRRRAEPAIWALALLGALLLLNLALPVLNLFSGFPWTTSLREITAPGARDAIRTSLLSAAIATAISALLGVPLAYVLARGRIPGRNLLVGIVFLPLVLPPIVAGVLLLLLYGPYGWVGGALERYGISMTNNLTGIVLSQILVAGPFVVRLWTKCTSKLPQRLGIRPYAFSGASLCRWLCRESWRE
jgi:ABC-type sulfate transport system permease component